MKKQLTPLLLALLLISACSTSPKNNSDSQSLSEASSLIEENNSIEESSISTSQEPSSTTSESSIEASSLIEEASSIEESSTSKDDHIPSSDNLYNGYYKGVNLSLTGQNLKVELYNKIKGHTQLNYDIIESYMILTERDWNLSPDPNDKDPYMNLIYATYNFNTATAQKFSNFNKNDTFDKEHIWAKSHGNFGTSKGAGSDLHHLRASDKKNNNARSNFDFGETTQSVTKAIIDYRGNPSGKLGTQLNTNGNKVYEPLDMYKGDVSRAMFYMATRYYTGNPTLTLQETLTGSTKSGIFGNLSLLKRWHIEDPVDEFELNRNTLVQNVQNNRNPFIDYPELVNKIW